MQKGASCTGTEEIKEGGKRWREREGRGMNRGERAKSGVIKENIIFKKGNFFFFFFFRKNIQKNRSIEL